MPAFGWSNFVIACGVSFCSNVMMMPMRYCFAAANGLDMPGHTKMTALPMC